MIESFNNLERNILALLVASGGAVTVEELIHDGEQCWDATPDRVKLALRRLERVRALRVVGDRVHLVRVYATQVGQTHGYLRGVLRRSRGMPAMSAVLRVVDMLTIREAECLWKVVRGLQDELSHAQARLRRHPRV